MNQDHTNIEHPEAGQTMAEYGVVLAVITVAVSVALLALNGAIISALNTVTAVL